MRRERSTRRDYTRSKRPCYTPFERCNPAGSLAREFLTGPFVPGKIPGTVGVKTGAVGYTPRAKPVNPGASNNGLGQEKGNFPGAKFGGLCVDNNFVRGNWGKLGRNQLGTVGLVESWRILAF